MPHPRTVPRCVATPVPVLLVLTLLGLGWPQQASAGFAGTDVFIPAVARVDGMGGARFYSTLWITNCTAGVTNVQIDLLLQGQANPGPISRYETIPGGFTRRIDDVVGNYFGVNGKGAALRVRSDGQLFVSSRTYSLPLGAELKDSVGLFFSGIPASLAVGLGETATLQGVSNGPAESFRYNFGLVETTGQSVSVNVTVRDENGNQIGSVQQYSLGGFEARQVNGFGDFPVPITTRNGRIDVTVLSGLGKIITYGTLVAGTTDNPGSSDSIGFEMGWRSNLLGGGVTRLNGLVGDLNIRAGNGNVSVTTSGTEILISATGSPGNPVTGVTAGAGLAGGGTSGNITLSVANQGIQTSMIASQAVTDDKIAPFISQTKLSGGPAARCLSTNGQTIPDTQGNALRIDFNKVEYDTDAGVSNIPGSWRYTVPPGKSGIYSITASVGIITSAGIKPENAPWNLLDLRVNGTHRDYLDIHHQGHNNSTLYQGATELALSAGQEVAIYLVTFNWAGQPTRTTTESRFLIHFLRSM